MSCGYFLPGLLRSCERSSRFLSRNGFVLISLLMPPILVLLFTSQFGGLHPSVTHRGVSPDTFFPGMMGYLILMLMTPAYNCFAYEGRGIQTYFTAPLRFRDVLLGKNLMHAGVLVFEIVLSMIVLALRIGLPSTPVFVATIAAVVFAVAGQFAIADWVSLSFPRKLEFGSMRGQRSSGVSIWVAFGVQIFLAGVCSLILLTGRWTQESLAPGREGVHRAGGGIHRRVLRYPRCAEQCRRKKEGDPDRNTLPLKSHSYRLNISA